MERKYLVRISKVLRAQRRFMLTFEFSHVDAATSPVLETPKPLVPPKQNDVSDEDEKDEEEDEKDEEEDEKDEEEDAEDTEPQQIHDDNDEENQEENEGNDDDEDEDEDEENGDDDFGDDFDDFEEGAADDDFDDFEESFQEPAMPTTPTPNFPAQQSTLPFVCLSTP